jgi:lysozyme
MPHVRRALASLALASVLAAPGANAPWLPHPPGQPPGRPGPPAARPVAHPSAAGDPHAVPVATPSPPVTPGVGIRGIDVSHYQGRIDWPVVAASGPRFVFLKATEGVRYVDPTYLRNKLGAERAGLIVGAYHFATPNRHPNDAVREADHFVDTARLQPGNLVPVLDLETTGGLSHRRLTRWILAWLRQVRDRLGVRPIVYTSPIGWALRTGDSAAIANAGYEQLWVAHWDVDRPSVPASAWGGHGWTFWQRSECGTVPGIRGCVDVDVAGRSLDVARIPTGLDVQPPTAQVRGAQDVGDPLVVTFDEPVVGISPSSVGLRADDGERAPALRLSCRSEYGSVISCATTGVGSVVAQPVRPLLPGERYDLVLGGNVSDVAGNAMARIVTTFRGPTELEQGSPAITFDWASVDRDNALGGSYAVERRPGATATFAFRGPTVTWLTAKGPGMGLAAVSIDGVRIGTVDLGSRGSSFGVPYRYSGLGWGRHELTIEVLGRGERHPSEAPVIVDGFRVRHGLVASPALAATWAVRDVDGGRSAASAISGASASVTFLGTGLRWRTVRGPEHGRAAIWVDGRLLRTEDTGSKHRDDDAISIRGLSRGVHTVEIVVLGADAASAGDTAAVTIDGFDVID